MWQTLKEHPYIFGGALGVLLLLYAVGRGSGSVASPASASADNVSLAGISASEQTAQLQANTAIALSNNQVQQNLGVAALQAVSSQNSNQTAQNIKQIEANAAVQTNHDTQVANETVAPALAQIAATNSQALAVISGNNALNAINAQNSGALNRALIGGASGLGAGVGAAALGVTSLARQLFSLGGGSGSVASGAGAAAGGYPSVVTNNALGYAYGLF